MDFQARSAVFTTTDVAHEGLGLDRRQVWTLVLFLAFQAHFLVPHQCIRVECSAAARARLQSLIVVVVEGCVVVSAHGASCYLSAENFVEIRRCLRTRSPLVLRFLLLLDVPLLFARLQVNFQALGTVFTAADVAHEHFWAQSTRRFLDDILAPAATFTHLLVLDKSLGIECTVAAITFF